MLELRDPSTLIVSKDISGLQLARLEAALTYTDQGAVFDLQRVKRSAWLYQNEHDWKMAVEKASEFTSVCLLKDMESHYEVPSGLTDLVSRILGQQVTKSFKYPEPSPLPFERPPDFDPYPYQREAVQRLVDARHAGVQMGTGLGKTLIIALVLRKLGLRTLIMAPNTSVAEQLHDQLVAWFGRKHIGAFFDGKKKLGKTITVGNAQSLTLVTPGSEAWKYLSGAQVFVVDESHQTPATTLSKVCFGLVKDAPYRFFTSATQMRNDGADLLLEGITGPIVYEMTVREGVDGDYLAKPIFHMIYAKSNGDYIPKDPMKLQRHHLFYNPDVVRKVAMLCNSAVKSGLQTLVLTREVEQFVRLLPHLRVPVSFAHGTPGKDASLPPEYLKSDPNKQVAAFNEGKIKLLVGTTCISTGTDVKATQFLNYWQGGSSEIQVRQGIGRGTRKFPGKTCCHVNDFWVRSPSDDDLRAPHPTDPDKTRAWTPGYHAKARVAIFEDLYGPVRMETIP